MVLTSTLPSWDRLRPRSFACLMDLYEANYMRLRKLIPDLDGMPHAAMSHVPGAPPLHLRIIERSRYTTTLHLTHYFFSAESIEREPDVAVRLYHDARMAHVIPAGKNPSAAGGDERWENNHFLLNWLTFCLHQGHKFASVSSAPSAALLDYYTSAAPQENTE